MLTAVVSAPTGYSLESGLALLAVADHSPKCRAGVMPTAGLLAEPQSRQPACAMRQARSLRCNHFEMLETLASPYGLIGRTVLEMVGQKAG